MKTTTNPPRADAPGWIVVEIDLCGDPVLEIWQSDGSQLAVAPSEWPHDTEADPS